MKDMLFAILALVAAVAAAFFFYQYTSSNDNKLFLVVALVCAVATVGPGVAFRSARMARKDDIHSTE